MQVDVSECERLCWWCLHAEGPARGTSGAGRERNSSQGYGHTFFQTLAETVAPSLTPVAHLAAGVHVNISWPCSGMPSWVSSNAINRQGKVVQVASGIISMCTASSLCSALRAVVTSKTTFSWHRRFSEEHIHAFTPIWGLSSIIARNYTVAFISLSIPNAPALSISCLQCWHLFVHLPSFLCLVYLDCKLFDKGTMT